MAIQNAPSEDSDQTARIALSDLNFYRAHLSEDTFLTVRAHLLSLAFLFLFSDTEIALDKVTAYLTKHTPSSDRCPDLMSLSPVSSRSDSSVSIELPKLEVSSSPRRNVREYPQSGIDTSLEFYRFVQERLALEDRSAKYATRNIGKTQLFVYIFICLLGFVLFLDIYP